MKSLFTIDGMERGSKIFVYIFCSYSVYQHYMTFDRTKDTDWKWMEQNKEEDTQKTTTTTWSGKRWWDRRKQDIRTRQSYSVFFLLNKQNFWFVPNTITTGAEPIDESYQLVPISLSLSLFRSFYCWRWKFLSCKCPTAHQNRWLL